MKNSISNIYRGLDLKVSLTLCNIPNKSGLSIQNNCDGMPVWTLCAADSKVSQTKSDPFSCITVTAVPYSSSSI